MSAPNSRPVHPCVLNIWEGNSGAEYATWAQIKPTTKGGTTPNLVTAQGSTLTVYEMEESTGKLLMHCKFPNLAGSVCYLDALKSPHGEVDALLIGFSGYPRLAVVTVTPDLLLATSLLDLTAALQEQTYGAVTPIEQDLQASLYQSSANIATLAVVLGGGVSVACLQLTYSGKGWASSEPFLLPLQTLTFEEASVAAAAAAATQASITTGYGDVLGTTFLTGYLEPTLVILHSNPQVGRIWPGRLGREDGGCRHTLVLTAITVTVAHERSAVLWSTEVPADALLVHGAGRQGCVVQCVNSIVAVNNTGQIQQVLAVNGWAQSTLPQTLQPTPNPWPFPQLSVGLDGAEFAFVNDSTAFVSLRCGQVYLLQRTNVWSLLPLYNTIGALGEVANIVAWPLGSVIPASLDAKLSVDKAKSSTKPLEMGLLFVGSRLGDSSLLGYGLETTTVADALKQEPGLKSNGLVGDDVDMTKEAEEYDTILKLEEEALYSRTEDKELSNGPNVVLPDEEDDLLPDESDLKTLQRKKARLSELQVVRSLTVLDAITAMGPLGPGCAGPLSKGQVVVSPTTGTAPPSLGSTGFVFPCGYGSSGGLAILTVPGRDDRTILAEEDCINARALFSLPSRGLVLMSMNDSVQVLMMQPNSERSISTNLDQPEPKQCLAEVNMEEFASQEVRDLLQGCELLAAHELEGGKFLMVVSIMRPDSVEYSCLTINDTSGRLEIEASVPLVLPAGSLIQSMTPFTMLPSGAASLGYTLSSGDARFVSFDNNGGLREHTFEATVPMDIESTELGEEERFYAMGNVTAMDIFKAPTAFFANSTSSQHDALKSESETAQSTKAGEDSLYDDEDEELYAGNEGGAIDSTSNQSRVSNDETDTSEGQESCFVAVCRQDGSLEIFRTDDLVPGQQPTPVWTTTSCGHGAPDLKPGRREGTPYRAPRMHKVLTVELRFFFCGPSETKSDAVRSGTRPFCLSLETSLGDTMLYFAEFESGSTIKSLQRVRMRSPNRRSKEQDKHFSKLQRKGIVKDSAERTRSGFRHNLLFRFRGISGQDGLFAAVAQPMWLVAERGRPTHLCHRARHAAPAGARTRPVSGFCTFLLNSKGKGDPGYITLHERVGRVGSQRLTVFNGLLNLSSAQGTIPGGGLFAEKIPMGVTVRRIQFIDDPQLSGTSPLYAVLVSRPIEADLSELNDDGLTAEDRQRIAEDKENAKIKRQVEADLGGFDIEQEWVEEIEREDCFKVDLKLGGAPPVSREAYSLWIVDAASGWVVVDSYEFEESEHGLTMQVMSLSEFTAEPGSTNAVATADEDLAKKLFVTVGTGIVEKDGEDVSSKGRVVLLEVTRPSTTQRVELNFIYEKKIFHGPVNSLSCLSSEGNNRLIIGAGADVNVEQWGNSKLTQVGFFRATMHVLDIKLFKNFFLLSDAYDSMYFLVWRESDKSLTLLAKDYDPIVVYATGLLSRGGSLDLVCHDDRQNLQFFQYAPGDAAARGGNKLVCRADYHLGSQTIDIQNHFCRSSMLINSATPSSTLAALQQQDTFFGRNDDDQRLGAHFGTTDGEYGAIIPLSEPDYWRLTALQSVMVNALESDCALSQMAWRLYRRSARRGGCRGNDRKKGVIDGDLVTLYADLALADQEDLASAIGSTVELILDNLLELRCASMVI